MSSEARQPRAILRDGDLYLRQADGSYALQDPAAAAPKGPTVSDAEIDRRCRQDPEAPPEPTDDDLKRARVVRPYSTSEQV
jgi:hypothetical protein